MNRGESGSFNCKLADHDLIKYLPSSQIDSHIDAEMQSQFSDKKVQLRLEKSGGANLIRPDSMPVKLDNKHIEARFSFSPATDQISGKYRCVVRDDITAGVSNFAHLSVKIPPTPLYSPIALEIGATYVNLDLNTNSYRGDGPITSTRLQYMPVNGDWSDTHPILTLDDTKRSYLRRDSLSVAKESLINNSSDYRLWNLLPDTEYEFRVLLTRPGKGGQGQEGPSLRTKTKCGKPVVAITGIEVQPQGPDSISVVWDKPEPSTVRCSSYSYEVQYRPRSSTEIYRSKSVHNQDKLTLEITDLAPFIEYEILVLIRNSAGFQKSDPVYVKTDEDVPGMITRSSFKAANLPSGDVELIWKKPKISNGQLLQYQIAYEAIDTWTKESRDTKIILHKVETQEIQPRKSHTLITGLYYGTNYKFTIRAATKKGYGPATSINHRTAIGKPKMPLYKEHRPVLSADSDGQVLVALFPAKSNGAPIDYYQVIVHDVSDKIYRPKREVDEFRCIHKTKYSYGEHLTSKYWVAGEIPASKFDLDNRIAFRIGDGKNKWRFHNPALTEGVYDIWYYAISKQMVADGPIVENCLNLARVEVVNTGLKPTVLKEYSYLTDIHNGDMTSKDKVSAAIILVGLLSLLIVTAIVAFIAVRQRSNRSKTSSKRSSPNSFSNVGNDDTYKFKHKDWDVKLYPNDSKTEMISPVRSDASPLLFNTYEKTTTLQGLGFDDSGYQAASIAKPRPLPDLISSQVRTPTPPNKIPKTPSINFGTLRSTASSQMTGKLHSPSQPIRVEDFPIAVNQMKQSNICGFASDFDSIQNLDGPCDVSLKQENKGKNRNAKIIPFDYSRVKLKSSVLLNNDYINASWISGYKTPASYIATQAPMDTTVIDFWDMVWSENARIVVIFRVDKILDKK